MKAVSLYLQSSNRDYILFDHFCTLDQFNVILSNSGFVSVGYSSLLSSKAIIIQES